MPQCCEIFIGQLTKRGAKFLRQLNASIIRANAHKKRDFNRVLHSSKFAAMEVSSQFKQVFNLIDTSADGKISSFELSEVLISLGHKKHAAQKESEQMIREMDSNGNGYIDLDEFVDAVAECGSKEDDLMDAFLIFDTAKNGYILVKELHHQVLTGVGYKDCNLGACIHMIKGVDKDGNGLVDFQ